ncbi:MAG: thiopurine S-methyltransferase [Halopseudomonas yangmingensis]|uniref:Thiopurine S-methyltransferase n=1 Tax=Halopseudomonas yangmingensis TaxID=1720063 RepID=A0A1I4T6S2_9GAMM|nr:thiopurine S-methyltransferase [Halopseudomonas yangmingensis]SFM72478.1 thiopurine S-methyltransferase [Halopseudomonas yangmingensis]
MQADFWHERWEKGEIGFHKSSINPLLTRWWPTLAGHAGEAVLVPLCGKTLDMCWLQQQGHPVVGVELSRSALQAFADEQGLCLEWQREGERECLSGAGLRLLCGDFFALQAADVGEIRLCYDRAALIALPPVMRARYAAHLRGLLAPGWKLLLISLDYDQQERAGPPFSVPEKEIRQLFAGCRIELLQDDDVIDQHPRFREQGMTRLHELVWLISQD